MKVEKGVRVIGFRRGPACCFFFFFFFYLGGGIKERDGPNNTPRDRYNIAFFFFFFLYIFVLFLFYRPHLEVLVDRAGRD
jgi:hypothetical protein